jgi:hypothetical protein
MAGRIKPLCDWGKGYSWNFPTAIIADVFDGEVEKVGGDGVGLLVQAVRRRMRRVRKDRG